MPPRFDWGGRLSEGRMWRKTGRSRGKKIEKGTKKFSSEQRVIYPRAKKERCNLLSQSDRIRGESEKTVSIR